MVPVRIFGVLAHIAHVEAHCHQHHQNVYMYMAGLNMLLLAIIPTLYYLALRTYPDLYINQYVPLVSGSYIKGCAYSVFFFLWGYFVEEHIDI